MRRNNILTAMALGVALISTPGISIAQDHGNNQDHGGNQNHGNDQNHGGNQQGPNRGPQGGQQGRPDYHFRPDDRNNFRGHYQSNLRQWQNNPRRPHFNSGDRLPSNYRIQAVPSSYYRGVPPPPPGYRFGYYDGYVVSYNPTTRIIADVLDLVTGN
jgi:Ni/Co efflux regulator RcnB